MALRRSLRHNPPPNPSTFSERENDADNTVNLNYARRRFTDTYTIKVEPDEMQSEGKSNSSTLSERDLLKKHNVTPLSVNVTRLSQRIIDNYTNKKEEQDVSESYDNQSFLILHQIPFVNNNLQDSDFTSELIIKSENVFSDVEDNQDNTSTGEGNYTHATSAVSDSEMCPDIHDVHPASTCGSSSSQDEEQLQNYLTSELIIKSEHEWSDAEENQNNTSREATSAVSDSEMCPDIHDVHPASTCGSSSSQDEEQLQNDLTSELIIKSEHEWSDAEENQNNTSREDLISGATENKTSAADFQEERKKNAKKVKFCAHCEFTTHSQRTVRNHIQAHVKSECEIGRQVDAGHLKCTVNQVSSCACQICGRVFKYKANFTRHLKLHENYFKGLYKCKVCKKQFDTAVEFSHHNKIHLNTNLHKCLQCNKDFKSKSLLNRHVKLVHEAVRSFRCTYNQCSKSFKSKSDLKKHLTVHSNIRAFKCDKCSSSFKLNSILQQHNKFVHSEVKPFECKKCGKSFKLSTELLRHSRVHSDVRPFACEMCGKMFKSKYEVKIHMNVHNMELNFKCEQCDKKFKLKQHLYVHNKRVHVFVRKFQCTLCDKKFKRKHHLSKHMLVHSDVRPFSCDICAMAFKAKDDLKHHGLVHDTSYDFKCNLCAAKFKRKRDLVSHIKYTHSDARQFKCNECEKSFKYKSNLRSHIARHLNLRQFKCDKCDRSFNCKNDLKSHSAVHSDIFAFKCHVCERKFKRKSEVKDHIFRLHM